MLRSPASLHRSDGNNREGTARKERRAQNDTDRNIGAGGSKTKQWGGPGWNKNSRDETAKTEQLKRMDKNETARTKQHGPEDRGTKRKKRNRQG